MKERDFKIHSFVDKLVELNTALKDSGGVPLSIEELISMSAIDLLSLISPTPFIFVTLQAAGEI